MAVNPTLARKTWRSLEPVHTMIYFAPEAQEAYAALGLRGQRMGYFASRAAALGPVPAEVVVATFFNFPATLVRRAIPAAWELASPQEILATRLEVADRVLKRVLGAELETPAVEEAAKLAREAAEAAGKHPEGRPLFAAHAALPWPEQPHLVLWHAQTLLREFRGDGHIAALLAAGLTGLEALVLHAATGDISVDFLRNSRGWGDEDWDSAAQRVRERGLLAAGDALALTDSGRQQRQWIEDRTDELAAGAYEVLGVDGCTRLRELARPLSRAIVDAGLLP